MYVHVSIMALPHSQSAAQGLTKLVTLCNTAFSVTSNKSNSDSLTCHA